MLAEEKQPYFVNTLKTVAEERQSGMTIYPPQKMSSMPFVIPNLAMSKWLFLGKTLITAPDRPTAWPSPSPGGSDAAIAVKYV